MRLIDADALIDHLRKDPLFCCVEQYGITGVIEAAPTIDAVPVVRCKDCKHAKMTYRGECKYCNMWDTDDDVLYLEGDFYCAFGERREDEAD